MYKGSRARVVLHLPNRGLRLVTSNNEVQYEALIVGLCLV